MISTKGTDGSRRVLARRKQPKKKAPTNLAGDVWCGEEVILTDALSGSVGWHAPD